MKGTLFNYSLMAKICIWLKKKVKERERERKKKEKDIRVGGLDEVIKEGKVFLIPNTYKTDFIL